ncbi:hypothetical protein TNCV_1908261 [Trichonephila clavipes]|nr:hypothetical protein TNCV_1908261 [Trichonephila clavipes]
MAARKIPLHLRAGTPSVIRGIRGDRPHPKTVEKESALKHQKGRFGVRVLKSPPEVVGSCPDATEDLPCGEADIHQIYQGSKS